jgi:dephospho-CoA kinase
VKGGVLDRQALGARVFGDKQALRRLEAIVHPLVAQQQRAFLRRAAGRSVPLVVLDIPLLFEGRGERRVDATMVVSAPAFLQRRRVLGRPGMTEEKFAGILRQQVPDQAKRRLATVVVPTGLGLAPTRLALAKAVAALKQRKGRCWPPNPWREKFTAKLAHTRRI